MNLNHSIHHRISSGEILPHIIAPITPSDHIAQIWLASMRWVEKYRPSDLEERRRQETRQVPMVPISVGWLLTPKFLPFGSSATNIEVVSVETEST